ncbi:MAG: hypothetical protein GW772_08335 [Flavobacteriia bacterium]|nr:hypothetical protein [Flavobacteriia bacterium]NCT60515.1 hypothetical protein [Flavobacteriia bacterium]
MINNIFCPNCGSDLDINSTICKCGESISRTEVSLINSKVTAISNKKIVDESFRNNVNDYFEYFVKNKKLSFIYFDSNSAKVDFNAKIDYLKNSLVPSINDWNENIINLKKNVARDKIEVYGRIVSITEFILKEFFGPFTIKENGLQEIAAYRDFGIDKISETYFDSNLNLSELKDIDLGALGGNVLNAIGNTFQSDSFKEILNKGEYSKSDIKQMRNEVGVAVAVELVSGITNMIGQNMQAIQMIREADSELNEKLKETSNVINLMAIEENESIKQKRLFDKSELILDICFEKKLKPIVNELNNVPTYIQYKNNRKKFDLEQEKIKIDNQLLMKEIPISFWVCLLNTKNGNYNIYRKKRIKSIDKQNQYAEINNLLNEKNHKSLIDSEIYKELKTKGFEEFEKENRRILKTIPAIINNKDYVIGFTQVIRTIKSNLIS